MQKLPNDYGIMYMYREYVLPIAFPPIALTSVVCKWFRSYILCKCKNIYIYMLLCNCVR
jgi:hypothetical protein